MQEDRRDTWEPHRGGQVDAGEEREGMPGLRLRSVPQAPGLVPVTQVRTRGGDYF